MTSWFEILDNNPETLVLAIPILAILIGGIIAIVSMWVKHRERMGMIEHGIHPDYPPEEEPVPPEENAAEQGPPARPESLHATHAHKRQ